MIAVAQVEARHNIEGRSRCKCPSMCRYVSVQLLLVEAARATDGRDSGRGGGGGGDGGPF